MRSLHSRLALGRLFSTGSSSYSRVGFLSAGAAILLGLSGCTYYATRARVHLDTAETDTVGIQDSQEDAISGWRRRKSLCTISGPALDSHLRKYEQSYTPPSFSGIARYDVVHLASNEPNEDDHAEAILPVPSGCWSFFGIFDGHGGWETSAWLRDKMLPAAAGALSDLYHSFSSSNTNAAPNPPPERIDESIREIFKALDDTIVHEAVDHVFGGKSRQTSTLLLGPAYAGSCALLAFYDSYTSLLRIALTGDSRAVVGRPQPDGTYSVHVLSVEQNGENMAEEYRLNAEHPGEAVVANGRVLGQGPSRAFGDARYKWSIDVQRRLKSRYLGRSIPPDVKTPPYFTAVPEVTTFAVQPGDFLVLASDGLWESLTSGEAVGLVGVWLQRGEGHFQDPSLSPTELPVNVDPEDEETTVRYRQWATEKRFVRKDENAATHLLRNALGGADADLLSALLSMQYPRSRSYRDDISVTVVFFGK